MAVIYLPFGETKEGQPVEKVILKTGAMEASFMTLGASVLSLCVPDRKGERTDVVLGYTSPAAYQSNDGYLGALVGRYANRIAGARFSIDGENWLLTANEGRNQLHGGPTGFSSRIFSVETVGESSVAFHYTAPDGENGYPGKLDLTATYTLTQQGLRLCYEAVSDKATYCNITNHSYFNLNGGGTALGHRLWIDAAEITPVNGESLPVAQRMDVTGTPFDFREEKTVGQDIGEAHEQLLLTGGYDHNYILRGTEGIRLAARLSGEKSGIVMEVWTDKPGVQLYTGNYLHTTADTKTGKGYERREGVCLETQFPPDSPNHPAWRDIVLRPGRRYCYTTEYRFV